MGWLIACENHGSSQQRRSWQMGQLSVKGDKLLTRGSVVIDATLPKFDGRPRRIVDYARCRDWPRAFRIHLNPDRSVSVVHEQGSASSYVRIKSLGPVSGPVRITYSWDGPTRLGMLSVECLISGIIHQAVQQNPLPMQLSDAEAIAKAQKGGKVDACVHAVAISSDWEPVGPAPSISGDTLVETPDGFRPISTLMADDEVITRDRGSARIRWIIQETRPAVGFSSAIRIRAPYFGLGRDLTVAATHLLHPPVTGLDYAIGKEDVLIEARHLCAHHGAFADQSRALTTYFQILLDDHDCLNLNGLWAESLFVGHLGRCPDLVPTTHFSLLGAATLPIHYRSAGNVLQSYETQIVLEELVA